MSVLDATDVRAEQVRASEQRQLRTWLRAVVVPGLEQLTDTARDPVELIALAADSGERLRAELEAPAPRLPHADEADEQAREDEREWVRGHLHDTALQILEFIAGDGFGTGLSAEQIAQLAGGATRDLRRWMDAGDSPSHEQLVPELERVTADARTLDPRVRLVVGELGLPPSSEQVAALVGAAREALTNARKHARATSVIVRVGAADDGGTAVTVTDDGVGCDPVRAAAGNGLGVSHSIVGRMQRVGGYASLALAPGGGTCVTLLAPMRELRA